MARLHCAARQRIFPRPCKAIGRRVRGEFLDVDGARIYYYAAGTRGAGEPIVFVHGFPTSGHLWGEVVPLLPAGHRVVVLDLLGYGRSDRPLGRRVDIRAHAGRVVQVLDELHIARCCLVGHGIGGGVALSIAVRHPHRVSHLGLIDSVAFDQWPTIEGRFARATLPLAQLLPAKALVAMLRWDVMRGYADPARAAHSLDLYLRPFVGPGGRNALIAHVRGLTSGETTDLGPELPSVQTPTAILWGQHDPVIPVAVAKRLQRSIAGSTLDVLPAARHFTPEEAPRQVADVIAKLLAR
jgi:pimeloyl-ACP methyl ester carboxylesterase